MFDYLKVKKEMEEPDSPELAEKLSVIAAKFSDLDEPKKAEKVYARIYDIYRNLYSKDKELYLIPFALCCDSYGDVLSELEKYDAALEHYNIALELFTEATEKGDSSLSDGVAAEYNNIGDIYFFKGEYDAAEENYKKALTILESLSKNGDKAYMEDVAYCYDSIAKAKSGNEKYSDAIKCYDKVISIYENITKGFEINEHTMAFFEDLATACADKGYTASCDKDFETTENYYKRSADLFEKLAAAFPANYNENLASQYEDISAMYEDMGNKEMAKEYHKMARSVK